MSRIALSENGEKTGRFFDDKKADLYKEDTNWNGNNWISEATGSQWSHESVYRTAGGAYVLNCYSQYEGSEETYEIISKREAAEWFVKNNYKEDELPEELKKQVEELEVM
jgi:hypothetical protein